MPPVTALFVIEPPDISNVPNWSTNTPPPPELAELPEIAPPVISNAPPV